MGAGPYGASEACPRTAGPETWLTRHSGKLVSAFQQVTGRKRTSPPPLNAPPIGAPLPRHAVLIAAIFVPYMALMVGLGYYIWRTGRPADTSTPDTSPQDEEDPGGLLAAA